MTLVNLSSPSRGSHGKFFPHSSQMKIREILYKRSVSKNCVDSSQPISNLILMRTLIFLSWVHPLPQLQACFNVLSLHTIAYNITSGLKSSWEVLLAQPPFQNRLERCLQELGVCPPTCLWPSTKHPHRLFVFLHSIGVYHSPLQTCRGIFE